MIQVQTRGELKLIWLAIGNDGAFSKTLEIDNNIPGANGFSLAKFEEFNVTVTMPPDLKCVGGNDHLPNLEGRSTNSLKDPPGTSASSASVTLLKLVPLEDASWLNKRVERLSLPLIYLESEHSFALSRWLYITNALIEVHRIYISKQISDSSILWC